MIKRTMTALLVQLIVLNVSAQDKIDFVGTYGQCRDAFNCFQIQFKSDSTFKYYINEHYPGKGVAEGRWKLNSDTVYLSISYPVKKSLISKRNVDSIKSIKIRLLTMEEDSLPISDAAVLINDSIALTTDNNGVLYTNSKINSLRIDYFGTLADSVFYFSQWDRFNFLEIRIPWASIEVIYLQPTKWIYKNQTLTPIWLERGKPVIRKDRTIRKVRKSEIVPELKISD